jgi:hypothetical protein
MQDADNQRRELNVQKSRAEAKERADRVNAAYDVEPMKRAARAEPIAAEHAVNEQVLHKMALAALHHCVTDRERRKAEKAVLQERNQQRLNKAETERLLEIVAASKRAQQRREDAAEGEKKKRLKEKAKRKAAREPS